MKLLKLNTPLLALLLITLSLTYSCKDKTTPAPIEKEVMPKAEVQKPAVVYDTSAPKTIINAIATANGGFENLKALKDVSFNYSYVHPDGKKDISTERYIFSNEASWAKYTDHEINVAPQLKGDVIQFYDGEKAFVYNNNKAIEDPAIVGVGQFLRQANYMWFTMMFKLGDPGTVYTYEGQEVLDGNTYDKLLVTYDPEITKKQANDIYVLYVNPETHLVEQFKFSIPAFKIMEPILLAKLTYKEIDGVHVITRRQMFSPAKDGNGYTPMVDQNTTNVTFNNGYTTAQLAQMKS